jgi:hypothetical protein
VPTEYFALKDYLVTQKQYGRVLWLPRYHRFGYYSANHPLTTPGDALGIIEEKKILNALLRPNVLQSLQDLSIHYIVIPYDTDSEIFQTDRKYDEKKYQQFVRKLEHISWLSKEKQFGKIIVFSVAQPRGHFWSQTKTNLDDTVHMVDSTHYRITRKAGLSEDKIIFSELFDPNWYIRTTTGIQHSQVYKKRLNSFILPKTAVDETVDIIYKPQEYALIGRLLSGGTILAICFYMLMNLVKMSIRGRIRT